MHVFETPGQVVMKISVAAGEVEVSATDSPTVEVEVRPLRNNAASRETAEETRVELIERQGAYEVVVEAPRRRATFGRGASIGVRVTCPESSRLEVSTAGADVRTTGRLGAIDAKTASGDLALDVVDGELRVATASGDVSIAEIGAAATVKSASGDIDVRLARDSVSVNVASGDVRVERALAGLSLGSASGDLEIGSVETGQIRLQSVSGDVRVGVREGLRVWIDASSVSGDISSELAAEDGQPVDDTASLEIRARTVSGDVSIVPAARVAVGS